MLQTDPFSGPKTESHDQPTSVTGGKQREGPAEQGSLRSCLSSSEDRVILFLFSVACALTFSLNTRRKLPKGPHCPGRKSLLGAH